MIMIALGTVRPWFNFFAVICTPCICIGHFGIIIITGVYRFGTWGKLCALTKLPTDIPSDPSEPPTDSFTYASDGSLILAFWSLQLVFILVCCSAGIIPTCRGIESNRIVDERKATQEALESEPNADYKESPRRIKGKVKKSP